MFLTTASPNDGDNVVQAMVAAKVSDKPVDDMMQATIQHHCCHCTPCPRYAKISSIIPIPPLNCAAVLCYSCDPCDWKIPYN